MSYTLYIDIVPNKFTNLQTCLVYLDDVIVYGQDFDRHLEQWKTS